MWIHRALQEADAVDRTWFVTLTGSADYQFRAELRAERSELARGNRWSELTDPQRFAARCKEFGKDVTLWLKRLRKEGCVFRYLVVFEAHKSGAPHVHCLIHEVELGSVKKRTLQRQWDAIGFSKAKLVDDRRGVMYAAKYIADGDVRIRASLRYGKGVAGETLVAPDSCRVRPNGVRLCDARLGEPCSPPPKVETGSRRVSSVAWQSEDENPIGFGLSRAESLNLELLKHGPSKKLPFVLGPNTLPARSEQVSASDPTDAELLGDASLPDTAG